MAGRVEEVADEGLGAERVVSVREWQEGQAVLWDPPWAGLGGVGHGVPG